MNMFLHELKAYRKPTFIWALSLALLGAFMLSIFPLISNNAEEMIQILEAYPEGVRQALGITLESFTNILGYYPFILGYVLLFGSIQAMYLGTSIIAKEVRGKTVDFLFAKPISRPQIITAKLFAALVSILFTNVVYIGVSSSITTLVTEESFNMNTLVMVSLTLLFLQMIFLALGVLLSIVFSKIKSTLSLSLGTVFTFYIISLLNSSLGEKNLRYLSPFSYFDLHYIVKNAAYETEYIILTIAVIAIAIAISYLVYSKKDIGA